MKYSFGMIVASGRAVTVAGLALLLCALILYWWTLDTGLQPEELVGGDLITHQYAQVQARPSNAPGYPLYTMGGWLWFHSLRGLQRVLGNPLPNPIPLLSSYSTLWALLALWLFYRVLCHLTRSPTWPQGDWPLAWLLSAFYAVTYFFWYYATTTEQYSSAVAQTLAIVYVYLRWQEKMSAEYAIRNLATGHLLLLAFLCGLSLAHMLTVALIVPPLVVVMVWQQPALVRSWRVWFGVLAAAALPLLSYLYVYVRGAAHPEWWGEGEWRTAQAWFWAFVSTAQGRAELGWGFEPGRAFFGNQFPELIWHELSLPLLLVGLIGIAGLGRKLATLLYGTLAIYLIFCWAYRYGNWFQVILPAYPLVLLGTVGLMQKVRHSAFRLPYCAFVSFLLVVAIGWRVGASWPAANSRNRPADTALDRAALLLTQPLPSGASLFAEVHDRLALQYLIDIWQIKPALRVVSSPVAAQVLAQGEPVFATWTAAPILRAELPVHLTPSMQSAGPDWIVFAVGKPPHQPLPATIVEQALTPDVTLYGYTSQLTPAAVPLSTTTPASLDITLFWRIQTATWPEGLSISVRPTRGGLLIPNPDDVAGGILQQDNPRPAHGLLDLTSLPALTPIADGYRWPLPPTVAAGPDGVQLILYRKTASGFENVAELSLPLTLNPTLNLADQD